MKKMLTTLAIAAVLFACNSSSTEDKKADEKKADSVAVAPAENHDKAIELIGSSDCLTCHKVEEKVNGPSYRDVAAKYEATEANIDTLVNKVINGGSGVWGAMAMTPHPTLSKEDARLIVKYILSLKTPQ